MYLLKKTPPKNSPFFVHIENQGAIAARNIEERQQSFMFRPVK